MKKKHVVWGRILSSTNNHPFMTCRHSSRVQMLLGAWSIWGLMRYILDRLPVKVWYLIVKLASLHQEGEISACSLLHIAWLLHVECMYGHVESVLTLGKLRWVSWQVITLSLFFHLIVLMLPAKAATCRRKVLLISKAGYLPRIQLSSGFQPIWPEGTSVPLIELTPASHQGLIKRWSW